MVHDIPAPATDAMFQKKGNCCPTRDAADVRRRIPLFDRQQIVHIAYE